MLVHFIDVLGLKYNWERDRHHDEKEEEEIEQEEVEENITDADDIKRACIGTIRAHSAGWPVFATTIRLHIARIWSDTFHKSLL